MPCQLIGTGKARANFYSGSHRSTLSSLFCGCWVLGAQAQYIAEEVKEKSGQVLDVSDWEFQCRKDIPRQNNSLVPCPGVPVPRTGLLFLSLFRPSWLNLPCLGFASHGGADLVPGLIQGCAGWCSQFMKGRRGVGCDAKYEVVSHAAAFTCRWDCGMFMLKYADCESRDEPPMFSQVSAKLGLDTRTHAEVCSHSWLLP